MDLIGKTLYIVRGNLRDVERGYKKYFDIDIIETKIIKSGTNYRRYAGSVDGYFTENIILGSNWFCEQELDSIDTIGPLFWRPLNKDYGTQLVITLSKEKSFEYKKELLKELNYTVDEKYTELRKKMNELLSSSKNLEWFEIALAIERLKVDVENYE